MKKLSEMNTVELSRALCLLAEPVANLFADEAVSKAFADGQAAKSECKNNLQYLARLVSIFSPVILGDAHREDVIAIVAAVKGVDASVIREQNGLQTVRDVVEMITQDMDLTTFFRSHAAREA